MNKNKAAEATPEWRINLGGKSYELLPSVDRLIAVERLSGLTIFGLVDRAAGDGLTLDQLAGSVPGLAVAESGDPFTDGLALITAQRERGVTPTNPALDRSIRHRIGGDIDCAEVTKRGVLVWQIGSFEDRLGEIIDPGRAAAPLVAN